MYEVLKKYDLDLSRMEDEALVVLSQECAFRPNWLSMLHQLADAARSPGNRRTSGSLASQKRCCLTTLLRC